LTAGLLEGRHRIGNRRFGMDVVEPGVHDITCKHGNCVSSRIFHSLYDLSD
jgi:hypothetical protein